MSRAKPRPNLFRALGGENPPPQIQINGNFYRWERTIKHDSWAATALYRLQIPPQQSNSSEDNPPLRVVCKFNRVEPIFFLPTGWLGNWLAGREAKIYDLLVELPEIPSGYREVYAEQERLRHAVAHDYIEGHPLRWHDRVHDQFFEALFRTLTQIHQRGIAYVDLNKWENIIIDEQGNPHLIDFQISQRLPRVWPLSYLLKILQRCDLYHLSKHAHRIRPDLYPPDFFVQRPWWITFHRTFAQPFRYLRRSLLVTLGIRKQGGKPASEVFIEEGLRPVAKGTSTIEQLYQLFASQEYQSEALQRGKKITVALFEDVMGRPACQSTELPSLLQLSNGTIHDQIVWTLKSPTVLLETRGWEQKTIDAIITEVQQRLLSGNSVKQAG